MRGGARGPARDLRHHHRHRHRDARDGDLPPGASPCTSALFLIALAYRIVYGVLGCYIAARLAPDRPMRHAMALGVVGVVLSTAGAVAMWEAGPAWYSLAVIAISLPCAWVGGRLGAA